MRKKFNKQHSILLAVQHFNVNLCSNMTAKERYLDSIRTAYTFKWGDGLAYYVPDGSVTSSLSQANRLWKDRALIGLRNG